MASRDERRIADRECVSTHGEDVGWAVGYLNARPLVYGLEQRARLFRSPVRHAVEVRARCCTRATIDLGMIPSIEYLRGPAPYRIVPGLRRSSRDGAVASVALFTRAPIRETSARIALDTSSRTSVGADAGAVPRSSGASSRSSCRWRRISTRCSSGADAALHHRRPGAVPRSRGRGRQRRSISARNGRALTGLPFVWALLGGLAGRARRARGRRAAARRATPGVAAVGRGRGRLLRPDDTRAPGGGAPLFAR